MPSAGLSGCAMPSRWSRGKKTAGSLTAATTSGVLPCSERPRASLASSPVRPSNPEPYTTPPDGCGVSAAAVRSSTRASNRGPCGEATERHMLASARVSRSAKQSSTATRYPPRIAEAARARPVTATIRYDVEGRVTAGGVFEGAATRRAGRLVYGPQEVTPRPAACPSRAARGAVVTMETLYWRGSTSPSTRCHGSSVLWSGGVRWASPGWGQGRFGRPQDERAGNRAESVKGGDRRRGTERVLRRGGFAQVGPGGAHRHDRAAAGAVRAGAPRRRPGPPEAQGGDRGLRPDRPLARIPILRQRHGGPGRHGGSAGRPPIMR